MMKTSQKLRVGYILKMFPRFSETFILNEILELERRGVEVAIFSLIPPTDGRFHSRMSELQAKIHYLPSLSYSEFWARLRQSPDLVKKQKRGYARALWHALECSKNSAMKYFIRAGIIADWCREMRLDHIHSHFASSPAHVAMYVSMMTGIPFSFIAHAKDIYTNDVDWRLFRELVKRSSFTVTVSDSNRDFIVKALGANYSKKIF
ncbi:MAG: glycosyltransferase family 4 protein, partial [Candidatus Aminicenantes bacterium]|nr:glycosyltransferase family 4 protein [Candidatus Aminicenantes bacterium]